MSALSSGVAPVASAPAVVEEEAAAPAGDYFASLSRPASAKVEASAPAASAPLDYMSALSSGVAPVASAPAVVEEEAAGPAGDHFAPQFTSVQDYLESNALSPAAAFKKIASSSQLDPYNQEDELFELLCDNALAASYLASTSDPSNKEYFQYLCREAILASDLLDSECFNFPSKPICSSTAGKAVPSPPQLSGVSVKLQKYLRSIVTQMGGSLESQVSSLVEKDVNEEKETEHFVSTLVEKMNKVNT